MISELFDEEVLRKQYNIAERRIAYEEGVEKGIEKGRTDALKEALTNLIAEGIDETKAKKLLGLA